MPNDSAKMHDLLTKRDSLITLLLARCGASLRFGLQCFFGQVAELANSFSQRVASASTVFEPLSDNDRMNISSVSSSMDGLAQMASGMQSGRLSLHISTAIMKEIMDSQKQFGESLINMINASPSLQGTGKLVDIGA